MVGSPAVTAEELAAKLGRDVELRQARVDGFISGFLFCAIIAVAVARW